MRMKVSPRFCQTVVAATATARCCSSSSHWTGSSWPIGARNWLNRPIDGWNSISQMTDATATDVATVDEKIVR